MDVLISPPYGKENCRLINDDGSKKKQAALEQVLKVVRSHPGFCSPLFAAAHDPQTAH